MDLVRLGERWTSDYRADELIDEFSSAIWTERYRGVGEFEINTPKVDKYHALLPEGTLISHQDTKEVMMVLNHSVTTDDDNNQVLKITGKDLKHFLNHRYVRSRYGKRRQMRKNYSGVGGCAVLLWNAFDNASGKDVTRGDNDADTPQLNDYDWPTKDKIPNIAITDSVPDDGGIDADGFWLKEGPLGPQLLKFMRKYKISLRCIRPRLGDTAGNVVTVTAFPLADRGTVNRNFNSSISALRFDLYKGVNRTSGDDKVWFSVKTGTLDNASYLWSRDELKTAVEIATSVSGLPMMFQPGASDNEGFQRQVGDIDVGEPDIPDAPERPEDPRKNATNEEIQEWKDEIDDWKDKMANWRNKRDNILTRFRNDAEKDANNYLDDHVRVVHLSGEAAQDSPFQYNVHYGLGDRVRLVGDFNMDEQVVIQEVVRTHDENGDITIPGFVAP